MISEEKFRRPGEAPPPPPQAAKGPAGGRGNAVCLGSSSVPDHALTQNEDGTAICNHIRKDSELDKDCGEGFDRAFLRLNGVQLELLREVKALGKPVVVVLITGRPLVLEDIAAASDAILLAWYPGTEGARILKWFAIPFSSGPHSVRSLHHDPPILGCPTGMA